MKTLYWPILMLSCSHLFLLCLADYILDSVFQFCGGNGYKYVTLADFQDGSLYLGNSTRFAFNQGIRTRSLKIVEDFDMVEDLDMLVFIWDTETNDNVGFYNISKYLHFITQRNIRKSILVISQKNYQKFLNLAETILKNSFFFLLTFNDSTKSVEWKQIITMNNSTQVIINDLNFDKMGRIKEYYDLNGLEIVCTGLTWSPYNIHENCNEFGRNCSNSGLLADMMDMWAREFNFTWDVYADIDGSWGLNPVSGPYNLSGEWKGVMGDVVSGKHSVSLSAWNWIIERDSFLDFVPVVKDRQILAVIPKPPEVDPGLFIRPFRVDTWQGIGIMFCFAIVLMVVPCLCVRKYTETTAFNIITTAGWFFFVLINAYYGGALTMFFVSEITLPFNTIRDALMAFPGWKIMYQAGNDAYFEIPASQGDEDYVNYMDVVAQDKSLYTYPNVMSGVQELTKPQTIIHAMDGMLRGAYKSNPYSFPNIKPFGATRPSFFNLLLTKNSPLTPILMNGVGKTFERGAYDRLSVKWQGPPVSYSGAVEIMVLSGGQVFLVFGILCGFLSISMIFLVFEITHYKINHFKDWKNGIGHAVKEKNKGKA